MKRQMDELMKERELVKRHEEEMRSAVLEEQRLVSLLELNLLHTNTITDVATIKAATKRLSPTTTIYL